MKVKWTNEQRISILDISPEQLALIVDAVDELYRPNNPRRPFSREFARWVDELRLELSKGAPLYRTESRSHGAAIYHLRSGTDPDKP